MHKAQVQGLRVQINDLTHQLKLQEEIQAVTKSKAER